MTRLSHMRNRKPSLSPIFKYLGAKIQTRGPWTEKSGSKLLSIWCVLTSSGYDLGGPESPNKKTLLTRITSIVINLVANATFKKHFIDDRISEVQKSSSLRTCDLYSYIFSTHARGNDRNAVKSTNYPSFNHLLVLKRKLRCSLIRIALPLSVHCLQPETLASRSLVKEDKNKRGFPPFYLD